MTGTEWARILSYDSRQGAFAFFEKMEKVGTFDVDEDGPWNGSHANQ
jgi:hypothetical protein